MVNIRYIVTSYILRGIVVVNLRYIVIVNLHFIVMIFSPLHSHGKSSFYCHDFFSVT